VKERAGYIAGAGRVRQFRGERTRTQESPQRITLAIRHAGTSSVLKLVRWPVHSTETLLIWVDGKWRWVEPARQPEKQQWRT